MALEVSTVVEEPAARTANPRAAVDVAAWRQQPYVAYCYGYPHKTAYRRFPEPVPLAAVWATEAERALSLYVHIPFCVVRCGFCNLFTTAQPEPALIGDYLAALRRQTAVTADAVPHRRLARVALGGGTPTVLTAAQLDDVCTLIETSWGCRLSDLPFAVEVSPATVDREKLAVLRDRGVDRLSIGVQSFSTADACEMGRPPREQSAPAALDAIRAFAFPRLNIDLIYGGAGQTEASWADSIRQALAYQPEEVYLYPLYIRPLTGLAGRGLPLADDRLRLYRRGRDLLLQAGYTQRSMRHFCRAPQPSAVASVPEPSAAATFPADPAPEFACQTDAMVGLGCGARSYTQEYHYSHEYAVRSAETRAILAAYVARTEEDFARVEYGIRLDAGERRRRYVILSLLQASGFSPPAYQDHFGTGLFDDFPELFQLAEHGLARVDAALVQLTEAGLELSDALGPWLHSPAVRARMEGYAWR